MKNLAIFLFFGIIFGSFTGISQDKINQMDAQGRRDGVWKKMYPETQQLRYEGTFDHGKEIGEFKFFCEECKDKPMATKNFSGKDGVATVKYFTIKGKLVSEGKMKGKERIGEWIYYQEKSKGVMMLENYSNGKLDGKVTTYYPNGKVTQETNYSNGLKEGLETYFSPAEVILKKLVYKNDRLQGPASYYNARGNVIIEGFYKDDKKYGLWKYYKDGKVTLEETYPKKVEK